ncbi:valine--pyruvate transaminase [Coraliomargarita sinensis]|uniref:Valine--pyruvate transaminase n=1 Tax=Coraliomargarita sinensis TaxID=2174842 RepID=A0A317ZEA3_9BACT|nr:valine--pyruvate transaminase [Coraliomargarita sinensis]PXA03032.1 valine--pyruvate transaminase [Coraliomargarita sinensis]
MIKSEFGQAYCGESGISNLMEDLGEALAKRDANTLMLGGGNPAHIPEVKDIIQKTLSEIVDDPVLCSRMLGDYDPPAGHPAFREALATELNARFGWPITAENIFLSPGSQASFFTLFNALAGRGRKIHLPLVPEYIGYGDIGVGPGLFRSHRPEIELHGQFRFKYRVHPEAYELKDDVAAVCLSRPTNPTGNVLTDNEVSQLSALTKKAGIPLILDNAYGLPFPRIVFNDAKPFWEEHVILCMSLSKFGLPATRTGIVIAKPEIVKALGRANTIQCLATPSMGPEIGLRLLQKQQLFLLSDEVIRPYYQRKVGHASERLEANLEGLPCRIHEPEGALFLWLWCPDLPITSRQLYERLKARGVLVIPGEDFFPGLDEPDWAHQRECLRISYAMSDDTVERGLAIIGEEVRKAYGVK